MTDRELLLSAAKAAVIAISERDWSPAAGAYLMRSKSAGSSEMWWNPLTDDGDALRLAVKLKLRIDYVGDQAIVEGVMAPGMTAEEAARRAIVRAAAAMGEKL